MSQPGAGEYVRPVNPCKGCGHSMSFHEPDFESGRISHCRAIVSEKKCDCTGFKSE